jgi:hypothetical protein
MSSILCGLFFGMAGLVAVTIEKNHRIVKTSLFAPSFGITFTAFTNIGIFISEVRSQMTEDRW